MTAFLQKFSRVTDSWSVTGSIPLLTVHRRFTDGSRAVHRRFTMNLRKRHMILMISLVVLLNVFLCYWEMRNFSSGEVLPDIDPQPEVRNRTNQKLDLSNLPPELAEALVHHPLDPEEVIDEQWMKQKEEEFRKRSARIREVCRKEGVTSAAEVEETSAQFIAKVMYPFIDEDPPVERPSLEHFSLAPAYETMGCFVNKVASSSLVSAFLLVNGFDPSFSSPHSLANYLRPQTSVDFRAANESFFKFTFVRHPMDRILSCYRDKMISSSHWSLPAFRRHIARVGREILDSRNATYRQKSELFAAKHKLNEALDILHSLRLKEKQDFMNDSSKLHYIAKKIQGQKKISPDVPPTFEEFLEYVLATDLQGRGYDSHWVPFWRYCTPCSVPYDAVGKLETAFDDLKYVWLKTGLNRKLPIPWVNRQKEAKNEDLEKKFYSSLPRDLILRFYERYRLDFQLFDYSINDVLRKAGYQPV